MLVETEDVEASFQSMPLSAPTRSTLLLRTLFDQTLVRPLRKIRRLPGVGAALRHRGRGSSRGWGGEARKVASYIEPGVSSHPRGGLAR